MIRYYRKQMNCRQSSISVRNSFTRSISHPRRTIVFRDPFAASTMEKGEEREGSPKDRQLLQLMHAELISKNRLNAAHEYPNIIFCKVC